MGETMNLRYLCRLCSRPVAVSCYDDGLCVWCREPGLSPKARAQRPRADGHADQLAVTAVDEPRTYARKVGRKVPAGTT